MKPTAFRIQMYKSIIDSGWIDIGPLTVTVGKNEAGKTTLLKALHKFKPFNPEPYAINREWPRGHRKSQSPNQTVCTVRFEFSEEDHAELSGITDLKVKPKTTAEVSRTYAGNYTVVLDDSQFPARPRRDETEQVLDALPAIPEGVGADFRAAATACRDEARRAAVEGGFAAVQELAQPQAERLKSALSADPQSPERQQEDPFVGAYTAKLREAGSRLKGLPTIQQKAQKYIQDHLPTFIYMDEYRAFRGTAWLDQLQQKKRENRLDDEDKTLLMILDLAGLDLDSLIQKGGEKDKEDRQYDVSDGAATLTRDIADRWKQRRYEVDFRVDGNQFMTFVRDERDESLIKLEERSKGFQWFFSFDLLLMYETEGSFRDCVILLDEPGLHLHPDAQRDLLARLEKYAEGNTLIYTTHMPFMIDLHKPDRIRVISETDNGTVVHSDLTQSQPEAKLVLQAALGMSGRTSFLLARQNLVVEGVDDYWVVVELSNLLRKSGGEGLPEDLFVTAAGGASEAAYIATLMIGQKLDVVVLLDLDKSGAEARDKLVKNWLTRYQASPAQVLTVGEAVGVTDHDFAIEDLFTEDFYLGLVQEVYKKELQAAGVAKLTLTGGGLLWKRVERAVTDLGIKFNKGSVAKKLRSTLAAMEDADGLPAATREMAAKLIAAIRKALPGEPVSPPAKVEKAAKPARAKKGAK